MTAIARIICSTVRDMLAAERYANICIVRPPLQTYSKEAAAWAETFVTCRSGPYKITHPLCLN